VGSMAFRWSSRLQMQVKSALIRSRIGHARRSAPPSRVSWSCIMDSPTTVDLYAIIDLVLWKTAWWFAGLLLCKKGPRLPEDHEGLDLSCNSLLSANYVWTMDMCCAVQLTTNK
jgi:hypothetical protein